MNRRAALELALAAGGLALFGGCDRGLEAEGAQGRPMTEPRNESVAANGARMPAIFAAHGSPLLLDDTAWVAELAAWARRIRRPRAVLMLSAHWVDAPITLGATRSGPLVYDFYGFPEKYYAVKYAAPGAPDLARRVRELLGPNVAENPSRGLDHGAYVPLVAMYPDADVPVLQVSVPSLDPAQLLAVGRALAPLRDEGVLVFGSGFLTHNLSTVRFRGGATPAWASEFDAWVAEALAKRDVDALLAYRAKSPGVEMALPTHEHFVPVLVALGASVDTTERVAFPIDGFAYGSFTRRSVQFG